jgi:chaperone modulatory protein CbpM
MVLIDEVLLRCRVDRPDLELWIDRVWVRPTQVNREWHFGEEDIARIELICDLMHDLNLQADAVDVILPLVDQIYDLRRSLRAMTHAVGDLPADSRRQVLERLSDKLVP